MSLAGGGVWWWQDLAPPAPVIIIRGGLPKKIRAIGRKGRLEREEPKPRTVREEIERILRGPQLADAEAPGRPVIPLTEAQRTQVIAALSAVPEEQLLAVGLDQALATAVQLIKDLERDDEEALIMILALTVQ